jgi:hypothetical protein
MRLCGKKKLTYYKPARMGKPKSLKITMANPCSESWDSMTPKENGRFCSNCKKVIIDFSQLSDQELLRFFSNKDNISCGRFHKDQLNKEIFPAKHKMPPLKSYYKAAAAVLALLTMRYSASASNKKENTISINPSSVKDQIHFYPEKITINGNVKDQHGQVLENAEIKFGDAIIAKTDVNGNFEFEISSSKQMQPSLLMISYPKLVTAVRNYHPAMLSTRYDITLYHPETDEQIVMGGIGGDQLEFTPVAINFTKNELIRNDSKDSLANIATMMKNRPDQVINITGY